MPLTKDDLQQIRLVVREEVTVIVREEVDVVVRDTVPGIVRQEIQAQLEPIKIKLQAIDDRLDKFWETLNEDVQLAVRIATSARREISALKKRVALLEGQSVK